MIQRLVQLRSVRCGPVVQRSLRFFGDSARDKEVSYEDAVSKMAEKLVKKERKEAASASSSSSSLRWSKNSERTPPPGGDLVNIKAYMISRGIDLQKVDHYAKEGKPQKFDAKSITVTLNEKKNQYVSIHNYGPVILFNVPQNQHEEHLNRIKIAATQPLRPDEGTITEDYRVVIHADLEGLPSVIKSEHLNIRNLDELNLNIVSTLMAQTVALDYYADVADRILKKFEKMNVELERNAKSTFASNSLPLDKQQLFRILASNNTVITNILSKLGIFEGSDAAWMSADYHYTWEAVRREFELEGRYRDLSLKLEIVQDNAKFYLGVLSSEKSEKLVGLCLCLNV